MRQDNPDIFFQRNSHNKFSPRAILVDMEPRVVQSITNGANKDLFDPRNVYLSQDGGSAGNQWVQGYLHGKQHAKEIIDMIDRQLDSCDNLEAFQLVHSVAGGTGSGFGSLLLEELSDRYNKKMIQTYSIFGASEVVVQPYNTMLTMKRLIQNSDCNVVFDNHSLMQIASENLKVKSPSYEDMNKLISTVMSASTNTLRFPSYSYNSLLSIMSTLIPTPDLHFLTPSYTPFTADYVSQEAALDVRRSTAYDVILELIDPRLQLCSYNEFTSRKVLSLIDIIISPNADQQRMDGDIQRALMKARQRLDFAPWTPSMVHLAMGQRSPYVNQKDAVVSGLQLANSTSVVPLLEKVCTQYDQLMHRSAFLNQYQRSDYDIETGVDIMDEFNESRELTRSLVAEYCAAESISYIEHDEEGFDDDVDMV